METLIKTLALLVLTISIYDIPGQPDKVRFEVCDRICASKVYPRSVLTDPKALEEIRNEILTIAPRLK